MNRAKYYLLILSILALRPAYGKAIRRTEMMIFNRWGEKIYESNDPLKGWDGFHLGELQPAGLYSYHIRVLLLNKQKIERHGAVLLVR